MCPHLNYANELLLKFIVLVALNRPLKSTVRFKKFQSVLHTDS